MSAPSGRLNVKYTNPGVIVKKPTYQKVRLRHTTDAGAMEWITVLPRDITLRPGKGNLICVGCPAPMKHTPSHSRKSGTEVPAYVSLYPRTEHAVDCRLNITTLHKELQDAHPDSITIEDQVLFLHLPDEERTRNRQSSHRRIGASGTGHSWAKTLNSAAAIARFLTQYDNPGEILNHIKIRYRDHRGDISVMFWADFCFPARSPQALKHLRRLQRDGDRTPPVAVIFPVKDLTLTKSVRTMRVNSFTRPRADEPEHSLLVSIAEPLAPDRKYLTRLTATTVLALGHATYFDWSNKPVTELCITITSPWQLAAL